MSHYTVAVFVKNGDSLEKLLAPYDEELSVPHYTTKAEFIAKERAKFEKYRNTTYAEYLNDPKAYVESCKNEGHIKYITEEFPKRLSWTDDDFYKEAIKYEDPEDIQPDGSVYSEYNPQSKWDWYSIGGRWRGQLKDKKGNIIEDNYALVKNIDFSAMGDFCTYSVITPDGQWHAPGNMGWWGMSSETNDEWEQWKKNYKKRFLDTAKSDWTFYLVDCHI